MREKPYHGNDICIVGIGCVLPDASNPLEFWRNLLAGKCSIRKIPEERWSSRLYFSSDKKETDKTYSNVAAFVENERLRALCDKLDLDFSKNNRLQIMALEATRQALAGLNSTALAEARKKTSVFLGCMELDEAFISEKFYLHNEKLWREFIVKSKLKNQKKILKKLEEYFYKDKPDTEAIISSVLTTSVISLIKQKFNLQGEGALIDAACASSLAAIDVANMALRSYQADLVITGGMESNLAPDTFVMFSKIGAISATGCLPFDKRADGLSQGEGTVVFALQRLEDAVRDKNKIYGIIKSIGASSDGRSSSLFSPSLGGQVLAYERAYKKLEKNSVDYIECHGTGTEIGDGMEVRSLNSFFKNKKVLIGSVKSLVGHTKGAAGAVGLLKCVLMMENKIISPSKYIELPLTSKDDVAYLNKEPVTILDKEESLRFGVSSFGFGNINYHLVLDEFKKNEIEIIKLEKRQVKEEEGVVIIGSGSAFPEDIDPVLFSAKFKIPPQSISSIDQMQLLALASAADAFEKSGINAGFLDKEKVSVVVASSLGLDSALALVERIRYFEFKNALSFLDEKSLNLMIDIKNKFPEVTEDTGHGILNNVIAGRICNVFDFKGKNFNVDSDFNSFPAALKIATGELRERDGIIILIFCDEKLNETKTRVLRTNVSCLLLSTLASAKKNNYPIHKLIKKITYHE